MQTKLGGQKARDKNLAKDPNFYKKIGSKGGKAVHDSPRGFAAATPEDRRKWGKIGGKISQRKQKQV